MKLPSLFFRMATVILLTVNSPALICVSGQSSSSKQDSLSKTASLKQPEYTTSRLVTAKPEIDGKLDDECWKKGTWAGDYHQFVPNEGAKPTYPTEMNIQYDDKNLYIAFRAYDGEPDKIVRMAGVRDEMVGDIVGINFDSYRDYRTGFEFSITAWGQKIDLILFNPMNWDYNWNAVWKGKTGIEDSAWVAELEVPLNQLRYSNAEEQVWGMHTWRWISRISEESNWERQSKNGPGMLYNFGELKGISGLKKSRRVEIMPFVLGELKTMKEEQGNPFTKNGRAFGGNMGLDAKIGVSSNFTVDLTINPDFGQVESDPSVMNLSAFETFYKEKRPFFLEGLTIFDYKFDDQSLFYSRRIGHAPSLSVDPNDTTFVRSPDKTTILSAIKFSGTTSKGLSLGFIQSLTANQMAHLSDPEDNRSSRQVEPLTNYMVARVQKGYNAGNTVVGGMLTSTNRFINDPSLEFLSRAAYTGGLDLLHHWKDKEFYVDARMIGSYVNGTKEAIRALQESSAHYYQRPGVDYLDYDTSQTKLSGFGGNLKVGKGSKGFWRYSTGATWLSPGLELNDLGYMRSADVINQENNISYLINQPVLIFHSYTIGLEQFNSWNFNGTYLGSGGHLSFTSELVNNWRFNTNLILNTKQVDTRILRGGPDMIMPNSLTIFGEVSTDMSKKVIVDFSYQYDNSGNNSATSYQISPGFSVRPIQVLKLGVTADYSDNRDNLQYVAARNYLTQKRYILGTINQQTLGLTFRVDLNISPEFSIQYYGSPFVSKGTYSAFKVVTNPEARSYSDRFNPLFTQLSGNNYILQDLSDIPYPQYSIGNPDFNFHEFRSNLVAKWEYRLGSFIYFVWSNERSGRTPSSLASFGDSYKELQKVFPNNIFLIKLNYWFTL
jgi:hypothetical protein